MPLSPRERLKAHTAGPARVALPHGAPPPLIPWHIRRAQCEEQHIHFKQKSGPECMFGPQIQREVGWDDSQWLRVAQRPEGTDSKPMGSISISLWPPPPRDFSLLSRDALKSGRVVLTTDGTIRFCSVWFYRGIWLTHCWL